MRRMQQCLKARKERSEGERRERKGRRRKERTAFLDRYVPEAKFEDKFTFVHVSYSFRYEQPLYLSKHSFEKPVNAWPSLTRHFKIKTKEERNKIEIQKRIHFFLMCLKRSTDLSTLSTVALLQTSPWSFDCPCPGCI